MEAREKIITKTFELLLQKGYDGVSISDIKEKTGLSRGLLYHYFGSKEALFCEASMHHLNECFVLDLEVTKHFNVEQISDYVINKYRHLTENTLKEFSIINYDFLFFRLMQQSQEFSTLYEKAHNDELAVWKTALKNSTLREGLDLDKIARQFIYTMDGVWLRAVSPNVEINLTETLKEALETLNNLIKQ